MSGTNKPLSEDEKRDAVYNAIMNQVPEIKSVEFLTKRQTGKEMSYNELKMYLIQDNNKRCYSQVTKIHL